MNNSPIIPFNRDIALEMFEKSKENYLQAYASLLMNEESTLPIIEEAHSRLIFFQTIYENLSPDNNYKGEKS
jgi:hypothetical protein